MTDHDIRDLQQEAGEHGDHEQVVLCLTALGEDDGRWQEIARIAWADARAECFRVIREARDDRAGR